MGCEYQGHREASCSTIFKKKRRNCKVFVCIVYVCVSRTEEEEPAKNNFVCVYIEGHVCQGQKRVPANYQSCQYAVVIPSTEMHSAVLLVPAHCRI